MPILLKREVSARQNPIEGSLYLVVPENLADAEYTGTIHHPFSNLSFLLPEVSLGDMQEERVTEDRQSRRLWPDLTGAVWVS